MFHRLFSDWKCENKWICCHKSRNRNKQLIDEQIENIKTGQVEGQISGVWNECTLYYKSKMQYFTITYVASMWYVCDMHYKSTKSESKRTSKTLSDFIYNKWPRSILF